MVAVNSTVKYQPNKSRPPSISNHTLSNTEINSSRGYYSNNEDHVGNLPGRSFASNCDGDTSNIGPSPSLDPM